MKSPKIFLMRLYYLNLALFYILFSIPPLLAQDDAKALVALAPFEWNPRTADGTYVSMIYDHISYLLANNSAVELVSRGEDWDKIEEERDLLKTEPFILTETIQQGKSKGAEKLLVGKVYLTEITQEEDGFSISYSIYLGVVNVESGVVEDNIMLSPRGLEDSDKILKVLRAVKRLQFLPRGIFLDRFISTMELFDLFATYNIAGITQDDTFQESLNQMDKVIVPFLDYHFGGITTDYVPKEQRKAPVVEASSESFDESGTSDEEMAIRYQFIDKLPENQIRVYGGELTGIRPSTKLNFITETELTKISPNGDTIHGNEVKNHGELKFERYEGDFSIFSMDKKEPIKVDSIVNTLHEKRELYLLSDKKNSPLIEEEKKFLILDVEGEDKLMIVAKSSEEGIKKNARFSLVREKASSFTDPNGEEGSGIIREEIAIFKLVEDRGDFQVLEVDKGLEENENLHDLIFNKRKGERVFVLFKLKHY